MIKIKRLDGSVGRLGRPARSPRLDGSVGRLGRPARTLRSAGSEPQTGRDGRPCWRLFGRGFFCVTFLLIENKENSYFLEISHPSNSDQNYKYKLNTN
ncbi:hypothetical protein BpHYR1_018671 [Brachionus plicatilis]|uniref:Uncharacterized protein n=1 Tax=Brachionus plicatilis TaxID=10195 RepID=A0A3M7T5I4_BRAPC|nr:hypothetical protein BpHYR1_018671 [Brachionus plicatilis]